MKINQIDHAETHKFCFGNETRISLANRAGCFGCIIIFPASDVKEWVDDRPFRSALCPKCFTDSVLADDGAVPFSLELLQAMHEKYFSVESSTKELKLRKTFTDLFEEHQQNKN